MDIASIAMGLSQQKVLSEVNISVLRMSMDQMETNSDELIKMMESSVTPNLGQNIDIKL